MDWVISILSIVATVMLGKKLKWGWIIICLTQLLWIYYALFILSPSQYGLVPAQIIVFVVSAVSAWKWFREDINK